MSWAGLRRWSIGAACATLLATGCTSGGQTGSETHWYATCDRDRDCAGALRCICGICTMPCTGVASCGSTAASACIEPKSPAMRALCRDDGPPTDSVCVATCNATSTCPSGLKCSGGVCAANAVEAGGSIGPGPSASDGSASAPDGAAQIRPRHDASVPLGDGGSTKPRPPPSLDGGDARGVDANGSNPGCESDTMPVEATRLASDSSLVLLSAPSGVYFATQELLVRRVAPNGTIDMPLGSNPLSLRAAGVGGILYTTDRDIHWFSPSEGRIVASWVNPASDNVVPVFLGDHVFGVEEERKDGGAVYRIVEIEPAPDGGRPLVHGLTPTGMALAPQTVAMTADDRALYYAFDDTILGLALVANATPRTFAKVGGIIRSLQLSAGSVVATWWPEGTSPTPGGIFAIDRTTGAQSQLVEVAQVYELRVFGDSVYYSTLGPGDSCRSLRRVPLAGGVPETLAIASFVNFEFGPTDLYLGTPGGLFKLGL
jgi:hypothetical protein